MTNVAWTMIGPSEFGQDVAEEDLARLGAARPRRLDELSLADAERLAAHQRAMSIQTVAEIAR